MQHDFMARVGNEIVVIKDVPAIICDTCGEVEYTLEVSSEIDVIMKEFFAGGCLQSPGSGEIAFKPSGQTRRVRMQKIMRPIPRAGIGPLALGGGAGGWASSRR